MPGTYSDEDPNASIGERVVNSIRKTIAGVSERTAPRSVVQAKPRESMNEAIAEGSHDPSTLARMHEAQTSDHNNSYNY